MSSITKFPDTAYATTDLAPSPDSPRQTKSAPSMLATSPRASPEGWVTAAVRPAGTINRSTSARLGRSLSVLAGAVDMVVLDLTAASVIEPRLLARALRKPGERLSGHRRCLLVVGGAGDLVDELERQGIPVASCAALPDNQAIEPPARSPD